MVWCWETLQRVSLLVANVRRNGQKYKYVEWFIIYFYFQYSADLIVFYPRGIRHEAGVLIGSHFQIKLVFLRRRRVVVSVIVA